MTETALELLIEEGVTHRAAEPTPTCTGSRAARSSRPPTSSTWCTTARAHCEAIMTVDLRHNVIAGFEHGFQDIVGPAGPVDARRGCRGIPTVAWCLADLERMDGSPYERRLARRAAAGRRRFASAGWSPVVGPELEFYLCEPDPSAPQRLPPLRRQPQPRVHGRRGGRSARASCGEMLHACDELGLGAFAANHEFGRSQYRDQPAPLAARWTRPTARSCSRPRSRRWRRPRGCWRRSSASPGTTTRARASTCTSRWCDADGANLLADGDRAGGALASWPTTSSPGCSSTARR